MKFTWFNLMPWPYLPDDFREKHRSVWVDLPNRMYEPELGHIAYHQYLDQLEYAEKVGFDGIGVNEHHANAYGLMPSPNIIASALTQRTTRSKIVVLGNLIPLHLNPLRIAEEYAMIDMMSRGRLIAGFAIGGGPEAFNSNQSSAKSRRRYWEAIDLVVVNLYPFAKAAERHAAWEPALMEEIDIGGPAMVRASANETGFTRMFSPSDSRP